MYPSPLIPRAAQVPPRSTPFAASTPDDALFEGEPIPGAVTPRHWRAEAAVHGTHALSRSQATTRPFLGGQVQIVRDDLRGRTWAGFVEGGFARLVCLNDPSTQGARFGSGGVDRLHLALDKHTGRVHLIWSEARDGRSLWLDGDRVDVGDDEPDFPTFAWAQPPIGHRAPHAPHFGLLGWRDRRSGAARVRRYVRGKPNGAALTVGHGQFLGGPRLAIHKDDVILTLSTVTQRGCGLALFRSTSAGEDFAMSADELDARAWGEDAALVPSLTSPVVDHLGFFHVPLLVRRGEALIAVNYMPGEAMVEAIQTEARHRAAVVLEAFPKKPPAAQPETARFGDGTTDGIGLIMVVQADGRLLTSNSQAGGRHFPPAAVLNHEMPDIAAFAATECYTSGRTSNTVSMDYLWLEGDTSGAPVSPVLHAETWDMPLPEPVVTASWNDRHVHLSIQKDATFMEGCTTFSVDDPHVEIRTARIEGSRRAVLTFDTADLRGRRVSFEVRSPFYHHRGDVVIGSAG